MLLHSQEECIFKVATPLKEAKALIEQVFEYVPDMKTGSATYKLFRRKNTWRPS